MGRLGHGRSRQKWPQLNQQHSDTMKLLLGVYFTATVLNRVLSLSVYPIVKKHNLLTFIMIPFKEAHTVTDNHYRPVYIPTQGCYL